MSQYAPNSKIGNDVMPIQISGIVALNVKGVKNAIVTIASTDTIMGTSTYSSDIITVADFEVAIFDLSRISVSI